MQAEAVVQKIRHYLISTMGRTADEASEDELYRAFCFALREEIMINWTATSHTFTKKGPRKTYYVSMEYLPGRLLGNNVANIGSVELVKCVLKQLGVDFRKMASVEPDMGIGNGGLGRLASCFMDSLATLQYPALGYGMRYQYGIFEQELWFGVQIERPDTWLLNENPWEFRRDAHAMNVNFGGTLCELKDQTGECVYHTKEPESVRALPYDYPIIGYHPSQDFSVLTLRLWSTKDSPRNFKLQRFNAGHLDQASENTSLTDVLYPNDNNEQGKRMRLKQEYLLTNASLQDIILQYNRTFKDFSDFGDKVRIQINDTHPALMVADLMKTLCYDNGMSWGEAFETTQACCSYTNHTVLKEALEEWNEHRVEELLPVHYRIIQRLNQDFCDKIRAKFPGDEEKVRRMSLIEKGQIRMANLAIFGSHRVNGVAALHTEIIKREMFKDFVDLWPEKFINVTNGVTQRRWLLNCNPELAHFITERIGDGWIKDFPQIEKLAEFADDPKSIEAFLKIKHDNKIKLLSLLQEQMHCHGDECPLLPVDALFDVQIKRFHEYKRQLMNALHALMLTQEETPRLKRMVIFGGKAAPGYAMAKNIIRLIYCIARKINNDPELCKWLRVVFVENYNVSKAEIIIPATDLSEQISMAGMEASGTGNMKFAMNGALTIGTDDGANVEMRQHIGDTHWPFLFGHSTEENEALHASGTYKPRDVCESDPRMSKVIHMLQDGSLTENDAEHEALMAIYQSLMSEDKYLVLNDLIPYYDTHKKVETLYSDPNKWASTCIHNMAGMGAFSTDHSITNYANEIWGIQPCPPDPAELSRVRNEFSEHDRCRIVS